MNIRVAYIVLDSTNHDIDIYIYFLYKDGYVKIAEKLDVGVRSLNDSLKSCSCDLFLE